MNDNERSKERSTGIPACGMNDKITGKNACAPLTHDDTGRNACAPLNCAPTNTPLGTPFYSPMAEMDARRRNLPHWQQGHAWCFVTWRLKDSLPAVKLRQLLDEKTRWIECHPEPRDEATENEYHERFTHKLDEWLDQGHGACVLREPENARIVANALRYFDGQRYELATFTVMPNHVHALFRPCGENTLSSILRAWKGFMAREINKRMGVSGALWQEESWDRLVRGEAHFFKCAEYVRNNKGALAFMPLDRNGAQAFLPVELHENTTGKNACAPLGGAQ